MPTGIPNNGINSSWFQKGHKSFLTPDSIRKIGIASLGRKHSELAKHKISEANQNEKHPQWKGDRVGYLALHQWIARKLGNPKKCEHCETTTAKRYDWANVSGDYKRDLTDWIRLCRKCHIQYDKK